MDWKYVTPKPYLICMLVALCVSPLCSAATSELACRTPERALVELVVVEKRPIDAASERLIAACLKAATNDYLVDLTRFIKNPSRCKFCSVSNRTSLIEEAEDIDAALREAIPILDLIVATPSDQTTTSWLFVLRQYIFYMPDLLDLGPNHFGAVDSGFGTMLIGVLPGLYDRVLIPKVVGLAARTRGK